MYVGPLAAVRPGPTFGLCVARYKSVYRERPFKGERPEARALTVSEVSFAAPLGHQRERLAVRNPSERGLRRSSHNEGKMPARLRHRAATR